MLVMVVVFAASCRKSAHLQDDVASTPVTRGSVRGHVHLTRPVPENEPLRMGADPMCKKANGGAQVLDQAVVAAPDGALANVFVELVGDFPETPVPAEPVSIDQRRCVYQPRVVGIRAGQALQISNSDDGLHNVHGVSTDRDSFNVGQPTSHIVNTFHPHDPGILRLKCDVHTWMVAFVGVVSHPYFAVTGADGAFSLRDVPTGTYKLRAWHERFGTIESQVRIEADHEAALEMTYDGKVPPVSR
jgi:plastocyanin